MSNSWEKKLQITAKFLAKEKGRACIAIPIEKSLKKTDKRK